MRVHRLTAYLLLAFGIAWGLAGTALLAAWLIPELRPNIRPYSLPYYIAVWSPAVAAVIVILRSRGREGLGIWARRLLHWRAGPGWYALVLVGIPALYLAAAGLAAWITGLPLVWPGDAGSAPGLVVALLSGTADPVGEIGWRGAALPLLQRRYSGLSAAIRLGLLWGAWQLPMFLSAAPGPGGASHSALLPIAAFLAKAVGSSVILSIAYNATGGSVLLCALIRWMGSLPFPVAGAVDPLFAQALVVPLGAALLAATAGRRYLGREGLQVELTGPPGSVTMRR